MLSGWAAGRYNYQPAVSYVLADQLRHKVAMSQCTEGSGSDILMLVIFCRSVLLLSSSSRSLPGPSTVEVNTTECQRWSRCGTVTLPVCCADRRRSAVAVPNMAGARLFHWLDFTEAKQPPEWLVFSATTTGSNSP